MKSPTIHFMVAVVLGIAMSVIYALSYDAVSHKSRDVVTIESNITSVNQDVSRAASARAALAEVSSDESQIRGYFVPQMDVVTFINAIEELGLAEKAPIKVLSVSTGGTSSAPTLLMAMTITGTFDAVMRTVGAIEYAPYASSVSTFSVGKDTSNSWHANLTLTIGSIAQATTTSST